MKYFNRASFGAVVLLLALFFQSSLFSQEIEPNNSIGTANFLPISTVLNGDLNLNPIGDFNDYFQIITPEDGEISVTVNMMGGLNGRIALYNANSAFLGQTVAQTGIFSLNLNCYASDTYYINVTRTSGAGSYTLEYTVNGVSAAPDLEPNNSIALVQQTVTEGSSIEGHLGYTTAATGADGNDFFRMILLSDGQYTFVAEFEPNLTGRIYAYYKNGAFIGGSVASSGTNSFTLNCLASDTLFIYVQRVGGCGGYSFSYSNTSPTSFDDVEPNNTQALTSEFYDEGEVADGHIGYYDLDTGSDNADYYGMILPSDGQYTFSATVDSTLQARIQLYYKNGGFFNQSLPGTGELEVVTNCLAADTLYARLLLVGGCGSYQMSHQNTLAPSTPIDAEPNNTAQQITEYIQFGESAEGHLGYYDIDISFDAYDWYGVVLPEDGEYTFTALFDPGLSGRIYAYYKNSGFFTQSAIGTGQVDLITDCLAADTIFIRLGMISGCGGYSLSFSPTGLTYGNDVEPNNTIALSVPVTNGSLNEGHLGHYNISSGTDVDDVYKISISQVPFQLEAKVTMAETLNGRLLLYNTAGAFVLQTAPSSGTFNLTSTLTVAGDYYIYVRRTSGCGSYVLGDFCGAYPNTPTISADGPLAFCAGGDVNLTSSPEASYEWSTGATTQSINVTTSGDYTVTVRDLNGCPAESTPTSVTVYPLPAIPTITASGPTTFCAGGSVTLTSSAAVSYLWSTGATTQSITVSTTGSYSVTVTDANGCSRSSAATSVVRNPLPGVPTVTASGPTTFCAGGSVTLTSSAAASYLWSTGATTQSITVSTSGTYSVTVTNANGCSRTSANTSVTVNPLPGVPTVTASGPTTFCAGGSVTLSSSAAASYLWSTGATTQSITVSTSGTYSVTVTNANGCNRTSANTTVTVNPLPSTPTITADGPTTFCDGQSVTLTSSVAASYLWSTGATTQSIVVTSSGSYSVTVSTASGCSASSSSTSVTVQPNSIWYLDSDGDGFGDAGFPLSFCTQPAGYVDNDLDCNDLNEFAYPGAEEICGNGIDDDCDGDVDENCPTCDVNNICTDMDVVEIGFGTANARVNATWTNPNGTTDCEVRGGRISPSSIGTGNPQFANINNTRIITQTDGSTVLFNIVLYNNPNVPFTVGQTYGYEVRCLCEDETAYTNWSGITPEATFVVPSPPPALQEGSGYENKFNEEIKVAVYPNPSNGEEINLSITGSELENAFIRIMDMNGKLISESRLDRDVKSGQMNLRFDSRLDRGVYMIQVYNETQMINQRFIVE